MLCGVTGRVTPLARRCAVCSRLVEQAANAGSSKRTPIRVPAAGAAILEAAARRRQLMPELGQGYLCAYSLILLETKSKLHKQGDYASFDHAVPNRPDRAELCSRIVNDFKGWMTDAEFRHFVCDVLDPGALRRLHGRDEGVSREFLVCLREVMRASAGSHVALKKLERLKDLSAGFTY